MRWIAVAAAGVMAAGALVPGAATAAPGSASREVASFSEVVARIPIGTGIGEVGVEVNPEETWGVSAFAVASDGAFYVVDGVNDKIVVLDPSGRFTREITLPEPLVGPEDVTVTAAGIYVLDTATQPGLVCRLDDEGAIRTAWKVPEEYYSHAITGITVRDDEGEDVFLELDDSWQVPFVEDGTALAPSSLPLVRHGNRADVPAARRAEFGLRAPRGRGTYTTCVDPDNDCEGTITYDERGSGRTQLEVKAAGRLGMLKALARAADGRHFAIVEELAEDGAHRETTVRAFTPSGQAMGRFRVPVDRFATHPNKPVRVSDDGGVYCLVAGDSDVRIERLAETSERGAEAAASRRESPAESRAFVDLATRLWERLHAALAPEKAHAAWTRLNASDRANEYLNFSWYCSKASYDRSCGDYKPAFMTAYGKTYYCMPYCWGGFDTVASFKTLVKEGRDAGDVNTTGSKRWCTAGVDCSGLVSRVWGLGTKRNTDGLITISRNVPAENMIGCDLIVKPGTHAILFRYETSTNAYAVWESTTSYDKDRVIAGTRTPASVSTYYKRRYNNW